MTLVRPAYSLEWHPEDLMGANTHDQALIFHPRLKPNRSPVIIWFHGAGLGGYESCFDVPQVAEMLGRFAAVGFTVIAFDGGNNTAASGADSTHSWGTATATARVEAWRQWLVSKGYSASKVGVMGHSMGGYSAMAYARDYPSSVGCVVTWNGAVDIAWIRNNKSDPNHQQTDGTGWPDLTTEIDTAWGIAATDPLPAGADLLSASSIVGMPYKAYICDNDPIIPTGSAQRLVDHIGDGTVTDVGGNGHFATIQAATYFDELASFYLDHLTDAEHRLYPLSVGVAAPPWYTYEGTRGGGTGFDDRMDELVALGAKWLRCDIDWNNIATNNGSWTNFAEWDDMVSRAHAKGLKVLGILMAVPDDGTGNPTDPTSFVTNWLTNHQKPDAIEVCNEQNTGQSGWSMAWGPVKYATFLSQTFAAVKAVAPFIPVGFGGMAAYGDGRNPWGFPNETDVNPSQPASYTSLVNDREMDPVSYVHKVIDALASWHSTNGRYPWDFVCHHPYANWSDLVVAGAPAASLTNLVAMHNLLVSVGDPGVVWATEYNVANVTINGFSEGQSEATIAQWLNDLFAWWTQQPWTGQLFIFTLDTTPNPGQRTESYTLLATEASTPPLGARRNTWTSLQQAIAAHFPS